MKRDDFAFILTFWIGIAILLLIQAGVARKSIEAKLKEVNDRLIQIEQMEKAR